jgi:hypothetical protein
MPYKLRTRRTRRVANPFGTSNPAIASSRNGAVMPGMSTKSREVIYGGPVIGAKIRAEGARKRAAEATREDDRVEAEAWSIQMEAFGGPAQPSPTIAQCLNDGYAPETRRPRLVHGRIRTRNADVAS